MVPYQYKPLRDVPPEIRLIHLLPGQSNDLIKIRIYHSTLSLSTRSPPKQNLTQVDRSRGLVPQPWDIEETEDGDCILFNFVTGETRHLSSTAPLGDEAPEDQPRYEALSYAWGNADATEFIEVEANDQLAGLDPPAILKIRPNLAAALRFLRYVDDVRILWIDAICINQEDVKERNEQVRLMTNIYAFSHRIIAWLGEESHDSKHALAVLQHIGHQLTTTRGGRLIAAPGTTEHNLWRNDFELSFDQHTWNALFSFVERAWFYRLWCWQEIKLGGPHSLLQCGSNSIQWNHFRRAVLCLHNKDKLPSILFRERCRHILFLNHDASSNSMTNILDVIRSKGCADPRDKIYGLLGITPASFRSQIVVDYLRPVEDVYKEAFLVFLNSTKRLELMKRCNLIDRRIGGPSWVPDWSETEFAAPILSEQLSSGISRAWYTYIAPQVLEVIGKRYTTIQSVSGIASKDHKTLLAVREWYQYLPSDNTYVTGEPMDVAFTLTLCMNRTFERHPYNHFLEIPQWIEMLHKMLHLTEISEDDPIYALRETANTMQKIRGRRFFTTESGHIGTAPAGAQVGR